MINIDQYIRELIMLSECIILPDFGGFESSYRPAVIDKKTNVFLPPSKQVVFKETLKRDNGVLFDYIARHEKLEKEKVREEVESYIKQLNQKLQEEKIADLKEIGTFRLEKNGRITFEAFKEENLLPEAYGLGKVHIKTKNSAAAAQSVYKVPVPLSQEGRKRNWLWITAGGVLIIVLTALLIPIRNHFSGPDKESVFSFHFSAKDTSANPEKIIFGKQVRTDTDSVALAVEEKIDDRANKEKALLYTEESNRKDKDHSYSKFYLIAGSFKNYKNATNMKESLIKKGYAPEIIQTDNQYYRVVLDSFTDRDYALKQLEKYRQGISGSVWILSI